MSLLRRFSISAAAMLLAGVFMSATAIAHPRVLSSSPAANAAVAAPNQIDVTFSEALLARGSRAELFMGHGRLWMKVAVVPAQVLTDGRTLRTVPNAPLVPGNYRLQWRTVGSDSHPMSGEIDFSVK